MKSTTVNVERPSISLYWQIGFHDDVIKWKHFPRHWPFVRGIHRSPVNSPHKGQWRGALMVSLICVWINGWVNNREAGDWRRHRAHYGVTVMPTYCKMTVEVEVQQPYMLIIFSYLWEVLSFNTQNDIAKLYKIPVSACHKIFSFFLSNNEMQTQWRE